MKVNEKYYDERDEYYSKRMKFLHQRMKDIDRKFKNYKKELDISHYFENKEHKFGCSLIVIVADARSDKRKHKRNYISLGKHDIADIFRIACNNGFRNYGVIAYIFDVCRNELSFDYLYTIIDPLLDINTDKQYEKWREILKWALVHNPQRANR